MVKTLYNCICKTGLQGKIFRDHKKKLRKYGRGVNYEVFDVSFDEGKLKLVAFYSDGKQEVISASEHLSDQYLRKRD